MLLIFAFFCIIIWLSGNLIVKCPVRELDRIDRRILRELQKNGRIKNVDLAEIVSLSPTPCLERVRRLEEDGYILGYRTKLNAKALRQDFTAFVTVDLERTNRDVFSEFADKVRNIPEIVECHMVGGGFDYLLKIRTRNMEAFREFLGERLSTLDLVSQTRTYFVMEEITSTADVRVLPED